MGKKCEDFCEKCSESVRFFVERFLLKLSAAFVFVAGSHAAADMPLGLVGVEHLLYLHIQAVIAPPQPFRQVFVNGGLADSELPGSGADGGVVFDDVHGQITGPFLHAVEQSQHSLHIVLWQCMSHVPWIEPAAAPAKQRKLPANGCRGKKILPFTFWTDEFQLWQFHQTLMRTGKYDKVN